ncbi:MAG TPA: hypothetical protein ENI96_06410 [Sedimenticola thiotaurini]|uniref:Alpha/beta hydrolase n=1 Tax=Sedimenticola thiotaurini TaxID=1543721 RepID=A0A831RM85_9GAMM|nr:hypothetical protein [Sedimenticola thiotaurini]
MKPASNTAAVAAPCAAGDGHVLPRGVVLERTLGRNPEQRYWLYLPAGPLRRDELLVAVHGISRNAREQADHFARLAERQGVVLAAPLFNRGGNRGYQRLAGGAGVRADRILLQIVDEVARLRHRPVTRLALFGYSAGGQFVHRFALLHPRLVSRYAIGAAGWYTLPDEGIPFPRGIGAGREHPAPEIDLPAFLEIPSLVLVGDRDTRRDGSLNTAPGIDRCQGRNRVERAVRWVGAMNARCQDLGMPAKHRLQTLAGIGHDFRQCMLFGRMGERVMQHLFPADAAAARTAVTNCTRVNGGPIPPRNEVTST